MKRFIYNRWGTKIELGNRIKAHQSRGSTVAGSVTGFDTSSNYAQSYGAQVKLDNGIEVGADDVFELKEAPAGDG